MLSKLMMFSWSGNVLSVCMCLLALQCHPSPNSLLANLNSKTHPHSNSHSFAFWGNPRSSQATVWNSAAYFWWTTCHITTVTTHCCEGVFCFLKKLLHLWAILSILHDSPQNFYRVQLLLWLQGKLKCLLFNLIFPPYNKLKTK